MSPTSSLGSSMIEGGGLALANAMQGELPTCGMSAQTLLTDENFIVVGVCGRKWICDLSSCPYHLFMM